MSLASSLVRKRSRGHSRSKLHQSAEGNTGLTPQRVRQSLQVIGSPRPPSRGTTETVSGPGPQLSSDLRSRRTCRSAPRECRRAWHLAGSYPPRQRSAGPARGHAPIAPALGHDCTHPLSARCPRTGGRASPVNSAIRRLHSAVGSIPKYDALLHGGV